MKSTLLQNCKLLPIFLSCIFFINSVVNAQSQTVAGIVRSATDNQPLPGVTVQIKGASNATATDSKGHYLLRNVSSSDSLFFSSVGFKNQTVYVSRRTEVNISLEAEASSLDQVVVVGYGTQRKSDLTGSVVRVSMDDKSFLGNTNLFQALSGSAAGVNVQGAGGAGGEH